MTTYKEKLTPAEELLVLSIKGQRTVEERQRIHDIYRELGDEEIFHAASINKVAPIVAHGLMESLPSGEINRRWKQAHDEAEKKLSLFFTELDRLAHICGKNSIRLVAIENGGIARGVQKCRGCFASSDIEILVNKEELTEFEEILRKEGYERRSRERCASENSQQWDRDIRGWDNYCKQLSRDVIFWLNIQWRPVLRRWVPMESGLITSDLIERSIPISDATSCVRILSPEDNLLVCALHVASHSYVRGIGLRLQLDIDRLIRKVTIDWGLFLNLAKKHQAAELVFPSLAIPHGLLDTPIPEDVFASLVPSEKKRGRILKLISHAGVLNRKSHKFSPRQFVTLEIALAHGSLFNGIRRVFYPSPEWIKEGYHERNKSPVLYYYLDRLRDLAKRRHA